MMFHAITEQSVAKRQINLEGAYSTLTHRSARASDRTNQFGEAGLWRFLRVQIRNITVPLPIKDSIAIPPRATVSQSGAGPSSIVVLDSVEPLKFKNAVFFVVVLNWPCVKAMVGSHKRLFSALIFFKPRVDLSVDIKENALF